MLPTKSIYAAKPRTALAFTFLSGALVQAALFFWLGGALQTPDSLVYLELAKAPLTHVDSWHPIGLPLFLYPVSTSPLAALVELSLLAGVCSLLIAAWVAGSTALLGWGALAVWAAFYLEPAWILLHSSLWSETLFVTTALAIGLVLDARIPRFLKVAAVYFLSIYLVSVRHAGLFLLPAIAIGVFAGRRPEAQARKAHPYLAWTLVLLGTALVFHSVSRRVAGEPTSGVSQQACVQGLIALTPLDICRRGLAPKLCALDPEGKWLSASKVEENYRTGAVFFDPNGPVEKYKAAYDSNQICAEYRDAMRRGITEAPLAVAGMYGKRIVDFFGSWSSTERGNPSVRPRARAVGALDRLIAAWNRFQFVFLVMAIASFGLGTYAIWAGVMPSAGTLFFLFASLGHAAGMAINNPFPCLRYLAVSKLFLALGFWRLCGLFRTVRVRGRASEQEHADGQRHHPLLQPEA